MDDGAEVQTNMVAYNFSYGVGVYDVISNTNGNNNLHLRTVLKIELPSNYSALIAISL
jgi:hypothetical protein